MISGKSNKVRHLFPRLIFLMMVIILSAGCHFPSGNHASIPNAAGQPDDFITPPINIQFTLQLPQPIEEGEQILIEILDEVTGLPHNSSSFVLEKISDLEYRIEKAFPAGSVLKYRYARIGDSKVLETQPGGEPVRYRLCHATNNFSIIDHLWGWREESLAIQGGAITGVIQNSDTQTPIPDILVSAGGQLTFTNANGQFVLDGLPPGVHNMVAYAMDGSYQTFQQGAQISSGQTTPAIFDLHATPAVQVAFNITPPNEIQGVPIFIAGNLTQLGNTFKELTGSMSVFPKKMPALSPNQDGTYSINLTLYAGTDLRFKFTLGDGFWNAERTDSGEWITHQMIIPNQDITINYQIASWRSNNIEPITFDIQIPPDNAPKDEIFIQFNPEEWTEPIPLWPTGGGNYLYILFSPLEEINNLGYRFCRNSDCQLARSSESFQGEVQVQPGTPSQTINLAIDRWENWQPLINSSEPHNAIPLPPEPSNYATIFELTPEMDASWSVYAPIGLSTIAEAGASHVVLTPRWQAKNGNSRIHPALEITPFHFQLTSLMQSAKTFGLKRGLFPQLEHEGPLVDWWDTMDNNEASWTRWSESYRQFLLGYAKTAEITQAEWLILGGEAHLISFDDGVLIEEPIPDQPDYLEEFWRDLISEIRSTYQGEILWATHATTRVDPLPEFISELDGIYIMIDSPLADGNTATFEGIAAEFSTLIDNHIYEVFRSTMKPVYLAFAYPSVDGAAQGCRLIRQDCANNGLFLPDEIDGLPVNLEEQRLIYSAVMPVVASRDWIAGTSLRGYQPTVEVQDGSSSIAGKPTMTSIRDWFLRINNP